MAFERDHWVVPIRSALIRGAGVNMNVGCNLYIVISAVCPEVAEVSPIETHDTRVEAVRIEIVIEDVADDTPPAGFYSTEKESSALSLAIAPANSQVPAKTLPENP